MAPSSVGSSPIRHPKKGKGKSAQLPVKLTKRSPKPFLNTHIAQLVRAGILYIQGYGFKSLCEYYLGVPEWSKGTDCKSDDSWVQIPPPSLCVI